MLKKCLEKLMAKRRLLVILIMVVFLAHLSVLVGNAAVNVAVLPFRGELDAEISFLKHGILEIISSRMGLPGKVYVLEESKVKGAMENQKAELDWETVRSIGYQLDADYLVVGELLQEGTFLTIKGNIVPVKKNLSPVSFSKICSDRDAVIPSASDLAVDLREKIVNFDRKEDRPFLDAPYAERQPLEEKKIFPGEATGDVSREKTDFGASTSLAPAASPGNSISRQSQELGKISLNYWRSEQVSHNLRGLTVGDADGDGKKEIVCITGERILLYRKEGEVLHKVAEYKENAAADFVKVDMIDSNGNGIEEIFVANREGKSLSAIVLEYRNDQFEKIAERGNWLFGVVHFPEEGPILLGQSRADNKIPAKAQIERMQWDADEGGYVSSGPAEIPPGLDLRALGILSDKDSREKEFVCMGDDGRLRIHDHTGALRWESEDIYGGSVLAPPSPSQEPSSSGEQNAVLPMRIITKDLNNDKKQDILVGKNFVTDKGRIRRKSVYDSGSIYDLQWNGSDMDARWQTERLNEILVDYGIGDVDNDGKDELVLAVRGGKSRLTMRPKSYILIYEIS